MRCAHLSGSVSRKAGGFFLSVRSLVRTLSDRGVDVEVFSLKDQWTQEDLPLWDPVRVHVVPQWPPRAFGYAPKLLTEILEYQPEILHSHGLWMYKSVAEIKSARKLKIPYIISPRGMLDPWALRHSRWKKKVVGWLFENRHLRGAACLHALCEAEAQSIRAYGLKNPIAIIPNGVDLPTLDPSLSPPWQKAVPEEKKVLLFLGRLHPKKGIPNLLSAWAQAASALKDWMLIIAGWDQGGHENELRRQVQELGLTDQVWFAGPLYGKEKQAAFQAASGFVLPSYSEGLPMAVLEAWSYALPVLMTKECNLPEGFSAGAAVEISLSSQKLVAELIQFAEMTEDERQEMGGRGQKLVKEKFSWKKIAQQIADVYKWILGKGVPPSYIEMGNV